MRISAIIVFLLLLIMAVGAGATEPQLIGDSKLPSPIYEEKTIDSIDQKYNFGGIAGVAVADISNREPIEISIWKYPDSLTHQLADSVLFKNTPMASILSDSLNPHLFALKMIPAGFYRVKMVFKKMSLRVWVTDAIVDEVEVIPDSVSIVIGQLIDLHIYNFDIHPEPFPIRRNWIRWIVGENNDEWNKHIIDTLTTVSRRRK